MKRLFPALLALLLFSVLLTACSGGNELNTVTLTSENGEFVYTFQADETEFSATELSAAKPFHVTLSVEYVGDQDAIDLWCADDLGSISMENENGQTLLDDEFHTRATSRVTLKKGEPYTIEWTGADEYKEYGGIPAGDYKVVAYINFSKDANYDDIQENTLDINFTVK